MSDDIDPSIGLYVEEARELLALMGIPFRKTTA